MNIEDADSNQLIEQLANLGMRVGSIRDFSMTEINNEITRRRIEAEQAETAWEEEKIGRLYVKS